MASSGEYSDEAIRHTLPKARKTLPIPEEIEQRE